MNNVTQHAIDMNSTTDKTDHNLSNDSTVQLIYALHSSLDVNTIIQHFAQRLKQYLDCDAIEYQHEALQLSYAVGEPAKHRANYQLTSESGNFGKITFSRNNAFADQEIKHLESLLSFLINPLKNAIEHLKALQSALEDPLTHVANRAALEPALHRELELAKRHQLNFSILSLDLDHFKSINDTFGHSAGDAYLKSFALTLKDILRDTDLVFRVGGEEFLALLTNTDNEGAINVANRIQTGIEALTINHNEQSIQTTVSVGVASFVASDSESSLLEKADRALYRAKNAGRNRVAI